MARLVATILVAWAGCSAVFPYQPSQTQDANISDGAQRPEGTGRGDGLQHDSGRARDLGVSTDQPPNPTDFGAQDADGQTPNTQSDGPSDVLSDLPPADSSPGADSAQPQCTGCKTNITLDQCRLTCHSCELVCTPVSCVCGPQCDQPGLTFDLVGGVVCGFPLTLSCTWANISAFCLSF